MEVEIDSEDDDDDEEIDSLLDGFEKPSYDKSTYARSRLSGNVVVKNS